VADWQGNSSGGAAGEGLHIGHERPVRQDHVAAGETQQDEHEHQAPKPQPALERNIRLRRYRSLTSLPAQRYASADTTVFLRFFYFGHVFYIYYFPNFLKFRAASRLTRSTFKITATKFNGFIDNRIPNPVITM